MDYKAAAIKAAEFLTERKPPPIPSGARTTTQTIQGSSEGDLAGALAVPPIALGGGGALLGGAIGGLTGSNQTLSSRLRRALLGSVIGGGAGVAGGLGLDAYAMHKLIQEQQAQASRPLIQINPPR